MKARAGLWFLVLISLCFRVKSKCGKGCDLALASFYVWPESNLTLIADLFDINDPNVIVDYNRAKIPNKDSVQSTIRINIPFSCDVCVKDQYLGHVFEYKVNSGDTYEKVVSNYSALTTVQSLTESNPAYDPNNIPDVNGRLNVTVNCSCGNSAISKDFGLFITYPLRDGDTLATIASDQNISTEWIEKYNPGVNFSRGSGIVFIPGKGV